MTYEPGAAGSKAGGAVTKNIESDLRELISRMQDRLMNLEPFRTLRQLESNQAQGCSIDAPGRRELTDRLESELAGHRDYRVLRLLRQAQAEMAAGLATFQLAGGIDKAAEQEPESNIAPTVLAPEKFQDSPEYQAASAAVAAMFRAGQPDAAASPEWVPAAQPIAMNHDKATDQIEAAEADVLASLAKLRTPDFARRTDAGQVGALFPGAVSKLDSDPSPPEHKSEGSESRGAPLTGSMATLAETVAATVAAAERASKSLADRDVRLRSPIEGVPDLSDKMVPETSEALLGAQQAETSARAAEVLGGNDTLIRFVARPASSVQEIKSNESLPPLSFPTEPSPRPTGRGIIGTQAFEEASVEIRKHGDFEAKPKKSIDTEFLGHSATGRGSAMLDRVVRVLRGDAKRQ